jgi:A/G-specific adenine glycosylase
MTTAAFRKIIHGYYRENKRLFPWRRTRNPYHIFISEIMLQQTQALRVVNKYNAFVEAFPDFSSLARAPLRKIFAVWQGLGYNRRALQLKKAAQVVVEQYKGRLPLSVAELDELPGIGPATAASIAAFAFNQPAVFIETNIRSVFIHFFFPKKKLVSDAQIFQLVKKTLDQKNPREWYNALMDYGAMLKEKHGNPNRKSTHYIKQSKFEGSQRQLRGRILRLLNQTDSVSEKEIIKTIGQPVAVKRLLQALRAEGLVRNNNGKWMMG